jgi:hypothetical protein
MTIARREIMQREPAFRMLTQAASQTSEGKADEPQVFMRP